MEPTQTEISSPAESLKNVEYNVPREEREEEILSELQAEGIIPVSVNKEGLCFYVSLDEQDTDQIYITSKQRKLKHRKRLKPINSNNSKSTGYKLSRALELYKEKLHEKGESGRTYTERFNKVKEKQERKAEELRIKLEKKMQDAEERLNTKANQEKKIDINEKLRLAKEKREALDKEFRMKCARKMQEDEERRKKFEELAKTPTSINEKLNCALFRREEHLKERQNLYLEKLQSIEKARTRREEIRRNQTTRTKSSKPY